MGDECQCLSCKQMAALAEDLKTSQEARDWLARAFLVAVRENETPPLDKAGNSMADN
jgi:hypothetical protein